MIKPVNLCDYCGKFFPYAQMMEGGGGSWCFVPEVDMPGSYEEDRRRCAPCTAAYGRTEPNQAVRIEMCCGSY